MSEVFNEFGDRDPKSSCTLRSDKSEDMKSELAALFATLLCQIPCIRGTSSQDDLHPGFLFIGHPDRILSLPANMTSVKQRSTKVSDKMDCVFACISTSWCRSVNFKITTELDKKHVCELIAEVDNNTIPKLLKENKHFIHISMLKPPCEENPCLNDGTCVTHRNRLDYHCECTGQHEGDICQYDIFRNCKEIQNSGERRNGVYTIKPDRQGPLQVYCDMIANGGGWTLISRFSNNDTKNWMKDDGSWWYDVMTGQGNITNTSVNQDMISPAFWSLPGSGAIKITRSDDPTHTALLQTTSNCLGSRTFRSMITSYGNFRNGAVWASDKCLGSCSVVYGGQYSSTGGFSQAKCSSGIQGRDRIGFWCDWSSGDGAVMMIGGGGSGCERADHGIGITEENAADFITTVFECDFGDDSTCPGLTYALNLWIR